MPDWKSVEELQIDAGVFVKFMHAMLGVYAWEFTLSLDFDWDFLTGKKKFRWPMIFYFANRYLLLFAMIGIAIALDTTTEVDCQALYTFNQLAGDAAVGLASINLSLRTIAVYSNSKYIIGFLVVIILGHWSLILQGVLLKASWNDAAQTCVIESTNNTVLAATFIYSMAFDLIVLCLNAYKLIVTRRRDTAFGASRLTKMIFQDGLIYFFVAFVANLMATVFMLLDLNAIMSVIFNVPAAIASTIVAGRVVRRLNNYASQGPEMLHTSSFSHSGNNFRTGNPSIVGTQGARGTNTIGGTTRLKSSRRQTDLSGVGGVHVQMETFTRAEDYNESSSPVHDNYLHYVDGGKLEEAKRVDGSETDLEDGYVVEKKRDEL